MFTHVYQEQKRFTQICVMWFYTIPIRPKHINTATHKAKNEDKVIGSCQQLLLLSLKFGHLVNASASASAEPAVTHNKTWFTDFV